MDDPSMTALFVATATTVLVLSVVFLCCSAQRAQQVPAAQGVELCAEREVELLSWFGVSEQSDGRCVARETCGVLRRQGYIWHGTWVDLRYPRLVDHYAPVALRREPKMPEVLTSIDLVADVQRRQCSFPNYRIGVGHFVGRTRREDDVLLCTTLPLAVSTVSGEVTMAEDVEIFRHGEAFGRALLPKPLRLHRVISVSHDDPAKALEIVMEKSHDMNCVVLSSLPEWDSDVATALVATLRRPTTLPTVVVFAGPTAWTRAVDGARAQG